MTMRLFLMTFLLSSAFFAQDDTLPPGNTTPLVSVEGRGVQIYRCSRQNDKLQWIFEAPVATLYDAANKRVGEHSAGPSWTWNDGSSVQGKLVHKQPSPDPGSIPWLLLSAAPASNVHGLLTSTTWIRRSATKGGDAPSTGCDAGHEQAEARVNYTATYTFYTATP